MTSTHPFKEYELYTELVNISLSSLQINRISVKYLLEKKKKRLFFRKKYSYNSKVVTKIVRILSIVNHLRIILFCR